VTGRSDGTGESLICHQDVACERRGKLMREALVRVCARSLHVTHSGVDVVVFALIASALSLSDKRLRSFARSSTRHYDVNSARLLRGRPRRLACLVSDSASLHCRRRLVGEFRRRLNGVLNTRLRKNVSRRKLNYTN